MSKRFILLLLFGSSAFLLAGCTLNPFAFLQQKTGEKMAEKLIESQTGGKVDIDSDKGKVTVKTKEGEEIVMGEGQLPANFPKDMPIYPGAKPSGSWISTTKEGKGVMVGLETNDGKNKVVSYYRTELPKNGWVIETTTTTDDGAIYIVKKNNRSGWVTITAEKNGKTTIGIVIGDEKQQLDGGNKVIPTEAEPTISE